MTRDWVYDQQQDVPNIILFDNQVKRRARVPHKCKCCKGEIRVTQTYYRTSYRDDDSCTFEVVKECEPCYLRNIGFE